MEQINNLIVVSDLHCGCQLGLCPPDGIQLDEGGSYSPSAIQLKMWGYWREFWDVWVPKVTRGEPYAVAVNGDATDGVHHGSVTQITHNLTDQGEIAYKILRPVIDKAAKYIHIRGTEAHTGKSGQQEEALAKRLGAIPNQYGQYAQWRVCLRVGRGLVLISHHIGRTSSAAYETSAPQRALLNAIYRAAKADREMPDVVVRSHRHRHIETKIKTHKGYCRSCVTAGWQLMTPFGYRIDPDNPPELGGMLVRCGDEDVYTRHETWEIEAPEEIVL